MDGIRTTTVSPLEAHLGYWLRLVSNEVSSAFARAIEERGMTVGEWVVLRLLFDREKQTLSEVARLTGMTRGAISKILDKLEVKALIARAQNPDDSRVQWLSLTRSGRRLVPDLAAMADSNDAHFFGALSHALEKLSRVHGFRSVPVD